MDYLSRLKQPSFRNQLAFYSLLASGAYILFLWSPHSLGDYLTRYTKIVIYLLPWLVLWLAYSWQVLASRQYRLEIILIISIIILGIINTLLSDSVSKSLSTMRNFLLTGVFASWPAMFLLTDRRRRLIFDSCCAGALAVIASVEIIIWLMRGTYGPQVFQIFAGDPIPLGTVMILLSPGPLYLILSKNPPTKAAGGLLLLLGGLLIFFTHKRGTWVAVTAMLALGLIYLARRKKLLLVLMLLLMGLILSLQTQRLIARFDANTPRYVSILDRLESYNFALHIWKSHPLLGIGLRSYTHAHYLHDYQPHNEKLPGFPDTVAKLQTFDNMMLTAWVEMGTAMTALYLALVIYILASYGRKLRSSPESSPLDWYRVLVLLGVAIHSLSYDSLLFPPVNWLFHVQLGIMAGYQVAGTAPAASSGRRPGAG